ncbi:protein DPCD-like [Babylonia areolata]|uniref:protein DPCD-like n=1 Tax=Babylonia areolata TaxID=304850 RepID=UPI003FD4230F
MAAAWIEKLKKAQKTCLIQDGRRKIHFGFDDGVELAEEFDLKTGELLVRKWRKKGTLGGHGSWETEVGDVATMTNLEVDGIKESMANPIFVRKDTKTEFQWRIRNLPYPVSNYSVTVDTEKRQLVLRTENKKYFKRFNIADLDRMLMELNQDQISLAHANNTLIISYKKPQEVLQVERLLQEEFKKLKASKDGDIECNPS